jgi:tetrahydromethanopterin S-methyltransferase subunit G
MTDDEAHDKVVAHDATLDQMNARLGSIERRLDSLENRMLAVGGFLGVLMTVYKFL